MRIVSPKYSPKNMTVSLSLFWEELIVLEFAVCDISRQLFAHICAKMNHEFVFDMLLSTIMVSDAVWNTCSSFIVCVNMVVQYELVIRYRDEPLFVLGCSYMLMT